MIKLFVCFLILAVCGLVSSGSTGVRQLVKGYRANPGLYYHALVDAAQSGHLSEVLRTLPAGDESAPILMEIKEWLYSECAGSGSYLFSLEIYCGIECWKDPCVFN
ncbi:MAG: hypothetical protein PHQ23_13720 [Candidatus Wallbacteria bacterium]|nr:hypothetical protein [Candidatus Wallbacteria bacterium]